MVVLLPQLLPVSIVYTLGMDDSLHVFQQLEFQLYDLTFGKLVGGFCTFDLVCRYILTTFRNWQSIIQYKITQVGMEDPDVYLWLSFWIRKFSKPQNWIEKNDSFKT